MCYSIIIGSMKNDKVKEGRAKIHCTDGSLIRFYIQNDVLDILYFNRKCCWSWNNNGFDSAYHPEVREDEVRKLIEELPKDSDGGEAKFYWTALELFEKSEDKGNN